MDIYKEYVTRKETSEKKLVNIGRLFGIFSLIIAVCIAPLLGTLEQAFQFIQEFTGFVSPGALAIFILGFSGKGKCEWSYCGCYRYFCILLTDALLVS